jgi:MFS family permease
VTEEARQQSREVGKLSRRTVSWLVRSVLVLTVILGVLGSLLLFLNDRFPPPSGDVLLAFVSFLIVGLLIALRRPENPIGWMFCMIGLASVWEFFAHEYAFYALVTQPGALPGGVWMGWSTFWTAAIAWPLMFFSLLLFPDGRLHSPRWRPFAWFAAVVFALLGVLAVFEPGRLPEVPAPNPTGIERAGGIIESSQNVLIPLTLSIVLAMAASVIVRFRQARGEERQQLKWLAYTAVFLGTLLGVGVLNLQVLHNRVIEFAVGISSTVAILAVPAAIGVAILRYGLYEIDIVINRTLVYGALTAALVAVYFGGVATLQALLRGLTGQEQQPQFAIVVSTLAIAALFDPLRRGIQRFIDRRFYRRKYNAAKTLSAFNSRLREETDLDSLTDEVLGVVRETMQPAHASLWLRPHVADAKEGMPS